MINVADLTAAQTILRWIAFFLIAALFLIAVLDFWLEYRNEPGVARRLGNSAGQRRVLAAGLAVLFGATLGHLYFWEPMIK